jgi:hypothetical protein
MDARPCRPYPRAFHLRELDVYSCPATFSVEEVLWDRVAKEYLLVICQRKRSLPVELRENAPAISPRVHGRGARRGRKSQRPGLSSARVNVSAMLLKSMPGFGDAAGGERKRQVNGTRNARYVRLLRKRRRYKGGCKARYRRSSSQSERRVERSGRRSVGGWALHRRERVKS